MPIDLPDSTDSINTTASLFLKRQPLPAIDAAYDPSISSNATDEPSWTPLQLAARRGDLVEVKTLITAATEDSAGDNPGIQAQRLVNEPPRGYYGQSALQAACIQGHKEVVNVLLQAGADVDYHGGNNMQRTALQFACGQGSEDIVDLLLAYESQVNLMKRPAVATVAGPLPTERETRGTPIITRYNGRTAIQAAAERGHISIVKKLLALGADVNARPSPSHGRTALQAASENGFADIGRLLLARGADANAPAARYLGLTALKAASLHGYVEIIELLIQAGADIHDQGGTKCDGTPLHAAAEGGQVDAIQKLINLGANCQIISQYKRQTPSQAALRKGQQAAADLIISSVHSAQSIS